MSRRDFIARPPHQPTVILSGTPELGWAPLTCVCWQINSILVNIGHRDSIRILNQYPHVPRYSMQARGTPFDEIY